VDRVGHKSRGAAFGIAANCIAAILTANDRAFCNRCVDPELFPFLYTFEFTVVSMIPLMTEVLFALCPCYNSIFCRCGRFDWTRHRCVACTWVVCAGLYFCYLEPAVLFNLLGLAAVWYISSHHGIVFLLLRRLIFCVVLFILALLWILVPALYGLPPASDKSESHS